MQDLQIGADHNRRRRILVLNYQIGLLLELETAECGAYFHGIRVFTDAAGRQIQSETRRPRFPAVDVVLLIDDREEVAGRCDGFRVPQQKQPGGIQAVMEHRQDLALQRRVQVNQQIPATDEIHVPKRRIVDYVLPGKNASLTDPFTNLKSSIDANEEAAQAFRGYILCDEIRVGSGSSPIQAALADVRAKKLDGRGQLPVLEQFLQAYRQGIRFLAGCATGDPYSKRLARIAARNQVVEQVPKLFKNVGVSKEVSDADQQIAMQFPHLIRVFLY